MTYREWIAALDAMADPALAPYQHTIISDTHYPMRCIRMPQLRKLAKEAAKGDWQAMLPQLRWETYEEVLAAGLIIAYAKAPFGEKLEPLRQLLPHLDSWAMTDSIVPTLKIKPEERSLAWDFAMECLAGTGEYTVRFGIVMLLDYFLTPEAIPLVARRLAAIRDDRYYVRMAVSWCLAELAVQDYERVEKLLENGSLDTFTHNMTIRKMRESYRITPQQKAAALLLKRKESK